MKKINLKKLVTSLVMCHAAGIIGSFFTAPAIAGWYAELAKPAFNPPGWIFAPVWLALYTLMGIALYLVWNKDLKSERVKFAIQLFIAHLIFNALWSVIFFGLNNILYAFIDIVLLWLMIILIILHFWRIDKRAAYLLIPYFLWVSFAAVLNFAIWRLN